MPDLDLLVPSSLVDPALAGDLLRDQPLPNLARVLARVAPPVVHELAAASSLTPWQAWVFAQRAGVDPQRVNLAELWAGACGLPPAARGGRYVVEPAHFKVANDHLRLEDPRELGITLPEARALAAVVEPVLAEAGWRLHPIEPATLTHWMVERDDGAGLSAAAIERAIGDNVAAWQPRSTGAPGRDAPRADGADAALAWRRCVNEVQMLWFGHEINEARDASDRPTVNTLWLSGNGEARTLPPRLASVESTLPLLATLPVDASAGRALETFDRFIEPSRRDDWSGWRDQLERFDLRLGGVLRQQSNGSVGTVTLVLCGREHAKALTLGPRDLGFWRGLRPARGRTTLAALFGEGAPA